MLAPMTARLRRARSAALASLLFGAQAACDKPPPTADDIPDAAGISASAAAPTSVPVVPTVTPPITGPMSPMTPPNPLGLPPRRIKLDPGRRVFTVSSQMLEHAKFGSTLVFYAATVIGFEGDDLIVEGKGNPSYKIHPGYVIPVPDVARLRPGDPVLTEWAGVMRHAVVRKLTPGRVTVKYTDMDVRTPEGLLKEKETRFIRQVDGLVPGNYAALREGEEWRHVLLVSPAVEGDKKRWFALGFGGSAQLVEESALVAIPVKWTPKVGALVWAEWMGTMRRATVLSADDPGFFTVKYERAGRPATVGWGLIMAPQL